MKVTNISRLAAREVSRTPVSTAWISISEPGNPNSVVENPFLGSLPNLKIAFDDATMALPLMDGTMAMPFSMADARRILTFLMDHSDKDLIVNCNMGVSRSGAIARFCQDVLDYEWGDPGKEMASPNRHVYKVLEQTYDNMFEND